MSAFERIVGFADPFRTRARVNYYPPDADEEKGTLVVSVEVGGVVALGYPTVEACREFAGVLLDAADRADAGEGAAE